MTVLRGLATTQLGPEYKVHTGLHWQGVRKSMQGQVTKDILSLNSR